MNAREITRDAVYKGSLFLAEVGKSRDIDSTTKIHPTV